MREQGLPASGLSGQLLSLLLEKSILIACALQLDAPQTILMSETSVRYQLWPSHLNRLLLSEGLARTVMSEHIQTAFWILPVGQLADLGV